MRRRVRKMVESFYGRTTSYTQALENSSKTALYDAFARNIYAEAGEAVAITGLVQYMHEAVEGLASLPTQEILAGNVIFVAPKADLIRENAGDG